MTINRTSYLTPNELFSRAPLGVIPRADVPGKQAGTIGPVVHTGASTGSLRVLGYVIDAYPSVVEVVTPGDVGVAEFKISTDGGATFSDPVLSDPNALANLRWDYEIGITGIQLQALNGSGTPTSFLAGDTWTFTTTAPQYLLDLCVALSALFRKWACNTGQPVDEIDDADKTMLCHLGRHWLTSDRGTVPEDWRRLAKLAEERFKLESLGDIGLNSEPDPNNFVFADYERVRLPYRSGIVGRFH